MYDAIFTPSLALKHVPKWGILRKVHMVNYTAHVYRSDPYSLVHDVYVCVYMYIYVGVTYIVACDKCYRASV